jgi:hypothetical protein
MHLTMHCRVTLQYKAAVQLHALIAQLVERLICNQDVPSSYLTLTLERIKTALHLYQMLEAVNVS